jgi:NAD(P)-dependent dehydrogenase (short-subunit alcohol dehydrogenase family)
MAIVISIIRFLIKFSVFGGVCFGIVYGILYVLQKVNQAILGNDFSKVSKGSGGSKHVMITGGSSGIGLEIARIYLTRGDKVTIIARNEKKLFEAVEELKGSIPAGKRTEDYLQYVSCDVGSSEEAVKSSLAPSIKKFGDVDILVNSAGTSIAAPFDELDSKEFERMFKINVLGSVYPTRVVLPAMKEKKRGKIIFVSSQVAQVRSLTLSLFLI